MFWLHWRKALSLKVAHTLLRKRIGSENATLQNHRFNISELNKKRKKKNAMSKRNINKILFVMLAKTIINRKQIKVHSFRSVEKKNIAAPCILFYTLLFGSDPIRSLVVIISHEYCSYSKFITCITKFY